MANTNADTTTKHDSVMKVGLKTNIIIDLLMLLAMAVTSFSGIVLKIIAPMCRHGQGRAQEFAMWFFQEWNRRTWKDIHTWTGIILLVLLVLHIVFHWAAIDGFFKKHIPSKALRYALYVVLLLIVLITTIPWLWVI